MAKRKTPTAAVGPTNGHVRNRIRLVIADGDTIDRAGLVALMAREPDLQVLDATSTVDETISACNRSRPDILLLTLTLPGGSGEGALSPILDRHPDLRVVALSEHSRDHCLVLNPPVTGHGNPRTPGPALGHGPHLCSRGTTCLRVAAERGARATVRRNSEFATLLEAIRRVHAGEICHADDALEDSHAPGAFQPLSERERMVAANIARGLSNKEIASALDISEATVKKHVGRVLAKLGLQDRLQVGLFLARNPLLLSPRHGGGPRNPARD